MLDEKKVKYRYREYTEEPLSKAEIERLLEMLGVEPKDLLRRNDAAFKDLGLTGGEPRATLIAHMAKHPTLVQRPIAVSGKRAVIGRPVEKILELPRTT